MTCTCQIHACACQTHVLYMYMYMHMYVRVERVISLLAMAFDLFLVVLRSGGGGRRNLLIKGQLFFGHLNVSMCTHVQVLYMYMCMCAL